MTERYKSNAYCSLFVHNLHTEKYLRSLESVNITVQRLCRCSNLNSLTGFLIVIPFGIGLILEIGHQSAFIITDNIMNILHNFDLLGTRNRSGNH